MRKNRKVSLIKVIHINYHDKSKTCWTWLHRVINRNPYIRTIHTYTWTRVRTKELWKYILRVSVSVKPRASRAAVGGPLVRITLFICLVGADQSCQWCSSQQMRLSTPPPRRVWHSLLPKGSGQSCFLVYNIMASLE